MYHRLRSSIDAHHVHPRGFVGRVIAARMARQHQPETDWTLRLLNLSRTDRVLELGFGGGRLLGLMAQQARFVAGLDLSSTIVRAARRRFRRQIAAGSMAVLQGDVGSLPLAPGQFTAIASIHTYYFWIDPIAMLARLAGVLTPHGTLVITLSSGILGPDGTLEPGPFGTLHTTLEQEIVPAMFQHGFRRASLVRGPDNRQYNNVALVGHT